jgi:hypothetical protein
MDGYFNLRCMDGSIGFCFSLVLPCYLYLGAALPHCSCTVREIFDTTAKDVYVSAIQSRVSFLL